MRVMQNRSAFDVCDKHYAELHGNTLSSWLLARLCIRSGRDMLTLAGSVDERSPLPRGAAPGHPGTGDAEAEAERVVTTSDSGCRIGLLAKVFDIAAMLPFKGNSRYGRP